MKTVSPRRFVIVVPPNATAGLGDALRQAFQRPAKDQPEVLERLIKRLDQLA